MATLPRPPWGCKAVPLLHVLLLVAASMQVLLDNESEGGYFRATKRTFMHWLMVPNPPADVDPITHSLALFDCNSTLRALQFALDGYNRITSEAVDAFFHTSKRPSLTLVQYKKQGDMFDPHSDFDRTLVSTVVENVNSSFLGPLTQGDDAQTRNEFIHLVDMQLSFEIVSWASLARRSCLIWEVDLDFSLSSRGHISLWFSPWVKGDCVTKLNTIGEVFNLEDFLWLNLVIIGLAASYMFFVFKGSEGAPSPWTIFNILACIGLVLHAIINLATNQARKPTSLVQILFSGLGTAILWVSLTGYVPGYGYGTLKITIERSFPKIVRFLIACLPTFLAYALFGMSAFGGSSSRFSSLKESIISLFSLSNGDSIKDTFAELVVVNPVVGQIYLYSFVIIFSYIVLNLVLAIVEEVFFVLSLQQSDATAAAATIGSSSSTSAPRSFGVSATALIPEPGVAPNWLRRLFQTPTSPQRVGDDSTSQLLSAEANRSDGL